MEPEHPTQPRFDWAGVIFHATLACVGFGAAYWLWPSGVIDKPISVLTLGEILRALAAGVVALVVGVAGLLGAIKDASEPC